MSAHRFGFVAQILTQPTDAYMQADGTIVVQTWIEKSEGTIVDR